MKRRAFITQSSAAASASLIAPSEMLSRIGAGAALGGLALLAEDASSAQKARPVFAPKKNQLNLDELHTLMETTCKDSAGNLQVGAFFSVALLVNIIRQQLRSASADIKKLVYPTPFQKISAGLN